MRKLRIDAFAQIGIAATQGFESIIIRRHAMTV